MVQDERPSGVQQGTPVAGRPPRSEIDEAIIGALQVDGRRREAGGFDVLAEVVGDSDAHRLELVTTRVKPLARVKANHTFLHLGPELETYTRGVR